MDVYALIKKQEVRKKNALRERERDKKKKII